MSFAKASHVSKPQLIVRELGNSRRVWPGQNPPPRVVTGAAGAPQQPDPLGPAAGTEGARGRPGVAARQQAARMSAAISG